MSKKRIPAELLFEICHSLPFRLRWATDRVALAFDHFVLKIQCVWMKTEFERQIKIEQKKYLLTKAKRELSKMTKKLLDDELTLIFDRIEFEFRFDFDFGVDGKVLRGMTSLEIFNKKLEKVLAERVDYDDPNVIGKAFLSSKSIMGSFYFPIEHRRTFPMNLLRRRFYITHLLFIIHIQCADNTQCHGHLENSLKFSHFWVPTNWNLTRPLTQLGQSAEQLRALALHKHSNFKRNEPSSLAAICELVAAFMDCPAHELANATTENAQRVFGLELKDNHHQQQQQEQQQCNNENDESSVVN